MGFFKTASVTVLGTASYDSEGLKRTAAPSDSSTKSYYVDGARKLDVASMLAKAAGKYDISANPSDYIYEAIRANTVNVPNENHDCFHRNELLRFDVKYASPFGDKVGAPVYMTYVGKPHHINHKADDPKRARGVILDAHYNDDAPALEHCPTCTKRTAEVEGRDESGIHCAACGEVVKDEFIETLVAVDTRKDPEFARNIRAGILTANSMGCNCASTVCNVCRHVAHSVSEFCEHIRGGNKGTLWVRKGSRFEKTKPATVVEMIKRLGYKQRGTSDRGDEKGSRLIHIALISPDHDVEIRKSAEHCQGVEYDELSRVHRPADPRAHTTELLKAAGLDTDRARELLSRADLVGSSLSMAEETELLLLRTRIDGIEDKLRRSASLQPSTYTVTFDSNTSAGRELLAHARRAQFLPLDADSTVVIPDGARIRIEDPYGNEVTPGGQPQQPQPGGPMPGGQPGMQPPPTSIEDVTQREMKPQDPQMSESEFGMLPPGASVDMETNAEGGEDEDDESREAEGNEMKEASMATPKFESTYGDFEVDVYKNRAVVASPVAGSMLTISAPQPLASDAEKLAFGRAISARLMADGLIRTAIHYGAKFEARFAQVTDGAISDMQEGRPAPQSVLEGQMNVMRDSLRSPPDSPLANALDDMQLARPKPSESAVRERQTDMADEAELAGALSATDEVNEAARETHQQRSMSDNVLSGGETDMKGNAGAIGKGAASTTHTAGKKCSECGESMPPFIEGSKCKSCEGSSKKDDNKKDAALSDNERKALEERYRKLYSARIESVKAEHAVEKKAFEESLLARVKRAIKIAARRQALNLEISPLKTKLIDSLTVQRPVGRTASGEVLEFAGMNEDLALHLIEAGYEVAAEADIDRLIERTAEIMAYGDTYIASAESDLSRQAMVVPQIVAGDQLDAADEVQLRAAALRSAASNGNLSLAPGNTADTGAGFDKAAAIRAALGPTKIGRILESGRN